MIKHDLHELVMLQQFSQRLNIQFKKLEDNHNHYKKIIQDLKTQVRGKLEIIRQINKQFNQQNARFEVYKKVSKLIKQEQVQQTQVVKNQSINIS